MNEIVWWTGTANHLWRTYFQLQQDGPDPSSPSSCKTYAVCSAAIKRFSDRDRDILRMFYSCPHGTVEYAVDEYSSRTGTPEANIYRVVKRAGYAVMNELELIDPYNYRKR